MAVTPCRPRPSRSGPRHRLAPRLALLGPGILALFLPLSGILWGEESPAPAADLIHPLVDRMAEADLAGVWELSARLEAVGGSGIEALEERITNAPPKARLGCAKALITMGRRDVAEKALVALLGEKVDKEIRLAAIGLLQNAVSEEVLPALRRLQQATKDPDTQVAIARAYGIDEAKEAREILRRYLASDDRAVRNAAALALGRIGYVESEVKSILNELRNEPTPEGELARAILEIERIAREGEASTNPFGLKGEDVLRQKDLKIAELRAQVERLRSGAFKGPEGGNRLSPLLNELLKRIKDYYVDEGRVDETRLIIAAAKGMVQSLDPYSAYMDPQEYREFREALGQEYEGIGARVQKDKLTGYLLILRPIYPGPAYLAGIRSRDLITEVDGIPTKDKAVNEIVKHLKGKPGTTVTVKVFRRGWAEEKEFTLTRAKIEVPSVNYTLLPGQIGFVRLDAFGEKAVEEMTAALDSLEAKNLQGLILDLRANPGGLLEAAVKIVDMFVGKEARPIVSQRGRTDQLLGNEPKYSEEGARPNYPMVILIDRHSASASEIVSGALKDFGRATLIGETTYGKGSVQKLIPLPTYIADLIGGESVLRLTVQHYFLPNDESIHDKRDAEGRIVEEGGVAPDVRVRWTPPPLWQSEARGELSLDPKVRDYAAALFKENRELARTLAEFGDHEDTSVYPGFDELVKSVTTHGTAGDIRWGVRNRLREMVGDERGREFACDYEEDRQLQAAILWMLRRIQQDLGSIPEYKLLTHLSLEDLQKEDPEAGLPF